MKEQSAQMALQAHQDAEAAAAEREAAEAELNHTREALEAEQHKVISVEVSSLPCIVGLQTFISGIFARTCMYMCTHVFMHMHQCCMF